MAHTRSRRQFFVIAGSAALAVSCGTDPSPDPAGSRQSDASEQQPTGAEKQFAALEQRFDARLGVFAVDLGSEVTTTYRADERFAFCSTFKVYAAGAVLAAADAGTLSLTDTRIVEAEDKVPESAIDWEAGQVVTLEQLCVAALTRSDNTAGNLLIDAGGGTGELTAFARSLGDAQFRLDRIEPDLNTALPGDDRDTTTPAGLAAGYRSLLTDGPLSNSSRATLLDWMAGTQTSDTRFRAGVPAGWTTADKTGTGSYGVSNDAGLLLGPDGRRILLVVLSRTANDDPDAAAMNELVADAVREIVARE
ncbi:class A beta-lactamase [Rhodococcus sp. 114MFTsu3.1]|uniref:class A beta-lactamase n=1 Tax=Rhodococcus sp. 114MFTsu3.1 TaxID=1172184 RepID=UPI0003746846|nr:class A beta-lactamase [Rhodococcus sp. 114MFTsu3.1]